jgi:hypothetical protein
VVLFLLILHQNIFLDPRLGPIRNHLLIRIAAALDQHNTIISRRERGDCRYRVYIYMDPKEKSNTPGLHTIRPSLLAQSINQSSQIRFLRACVRNTNPDLSLSVRLIKEIEKCSIEHC